MDRHNWVYSFGIEFKKQIMVLESRSLNEICLNQFRDDPDTFLCPSGGTHDTSRRSFVIFLRGYLPLWLKPTVL